MQTKTDYSYGVVPIRYTTEGEREYLLIHQYSLVKGTYYWIFPKGHAELNESPEQTALRELQEETGLHAELLIDPTFSIVYDFVHEGVLIKKEAVFFIGKVKSESSIQLQAEEVKEARWCNYETALTTLTYDNARELITSVDQHLTSLPK